MKPTITILKARPAFGQFTITLIIGLLLGGALVALATGGHVNDSHWEDIAAGLCLLVTGIAITWLAHRNAILDLQMDKVSLSEQRNIYEEEMAKQRSKAVAAEGRATFYESQAKRIKAKHDGLFLEVDNLKAAWEARKEDDKEFLRLQKLTSEENLLLLDQKLVLEAQVHAFTLYVEELENMIDNPDNHERPEYFTRAFPVEPAGQTEHAPQAGA